MSLLASRVQCWIADSPQFDKNMTRPCEYGALDFFVAQSDSGRSFVTPDMRDKALNSIGKTLQIPVINYDGDVTVSNVRTCTIADAENTSAMVTVAFATFGVGFTMVPALFLNNLISLQHDFNRKMEKSARAMANALDIAAVAALAANKTQVFKDALGYTVGGNTLTTEWENRMEIMGDINPIMRANCYPGQLHIVGNAGIDSLTRKMAQLGGNNAINKVLEYNDKIFHYTNNVQNETGKYGSAYVIEDGQVGYLTRSGREHILGTRAADHEFSIMRLPILGMPVDFHGYLEVGNQSAIAGESSADMTCNLKEFYSFMVDVAFLVSYNSNPATIANPILKFDIDSPTAQRGGIPVFVTNN